MKRGASDLWRTCATLDLISDSVGDHGHSCSNHGCSWNCSQLTAQDIDAMMASLSNWGRWGKNDQLGALNLITPEKRRAAVQEVKDGSSVSLAHDVIKVKIGGSEPFVHRMISTGRLPALIARSMHILCNITATHRLISMLSHIFFTKGGCTTAFPRRR